METGVVPTAAGRGEQAMGLAAAKDLLFGSVSRNLLLRYPRRSESRANSRAVSRDDWKNYRIPF